MSEIHKRGADGILDDGTRIDPVTYNDIQRYREAREILSEWSAPVLFHAEYSQERLAILNMDGTGNDMVDDPEHVTNIGLLQGQLSKLAEKNVHIASIYERGIGTEKGALKKDVDGAWGYTYEQHIEHAYAQFIKQVRQWKAEDPDSQIRVVITGFSRGGEEAAGLARLIDERGIKDPRDTVIHHHYGASDTYTYTSDYPLLVAPGKTMQAVMLFDPVGTGEPNRHDRRLPSSVVSGFQITARDERRDAFASTQIIPDGLSKDGRFLQITVPGAHGDIGGSYHHDGLSRLNFNMAVAYINTLSDKPLLHELDLPQNPHRYVIHHSEDHRFVYTTRYFLEHREREVLGAQMDAPACRPTIACLPPEPLSPALIATMPESLPVTIASLTILHDHVAVPVTVQQADVEQDRLWKMRTQQFDELQLQRESERERSSEKGPSVSVEPVSSLYHAADSIKHGSERKKIEHFEGLAQTQRQDPDSLDARLNRMLAAAQSNDWGAFRKDVQAFANMQPGRDLIAHGKAMVHLELDLMRQHYVEIQHMQQTFQQAVEQQRAPQLSQGMAR